VVTRPDRAWARSSSCKPLETERRIETVVLTSQYAEEVEKASMEVVGRRGGEGPRIAAARRLQAGPQVSAECL